MKKINTREKGGFYENISREYLVSKDFKILDNNFKCKLGEIDIIAIKNNVLHFIEVKYRNSDQYGHPLESISSCKQRKIKKVANYYLTFIYKNEIDCSFDALCILNNDIIYVENCF